ncbi:hypothetical protein SAY87_021547 [Trapa incisa]|uniref:Uncharacterized protein n=1 Tax=Trapa incisa TaxID=236973 RepID=A0AAN7PRP6_9MYRT|nr:hypothetical protein SAY87_021547 [Trapa incisa]
MSERSFSSGEGEEAPREPCHVLHKLRVHHLEDAPLLVGLNDLPADLGPASPRLIVDPVEASLNTLHSIALSVSLWAVAALKKPYNGGSKWTQASGPEMLTRTAGPHHWVQSAGSEFSACLESKIRT